MKSLSWLAVAILAVALPAVLHAKEDPVHWTLSPADGKAVVAPGAVAYFELKATVDPGGIFIRLQPLRAAPSSQKYKSVRIRCCKIRVFTALNPFASSTPISKWTPKRIRAKRSSLRR